MRTGRRMGILLRRPEFLPTRRPFAPPNRSYSAPEASTRESITLPDQRTLSFAHYGASNGYPVFYFHGHPGSRLESVVVHEDAAELGARIISIDRPGIGYSTPQPGRTASNHAADVAYLATELGLKEYKILAVSGGGPFALACARHHSPTNLRAVALLAGMAYLPGVGYRGMRMGNKFLFHITKSMPGFTRWLAGFLASRQLSLSDGQLIDISQKQLNSSLKRIPPKDRATLGDGDFLRLMLPSTREHFRQGLNGLMDEFRTHHKELEFRLEDIDVPISLWYGEQDINVPSLIGEELAKRLGVTSKLTILDETHISLLMNQKRRILEDLLSR